MEHEVVEAAGKFGASQVALAAAIFAGLAALSSLFASLAAWWQVRIMKRMQFSSVELYIASSTGPAGYEKVTLNARN